MPKKDAEGYIISETGNWNVADQYTKNKIMRPLNMCDYYEDIAYFGYESLVDELINVQSIPNDIIRIKAIKRLIRELIRVIDNSKFALKRPGTMKEILGYKKALQTLEQIIPNLVKINYDSINETRTIKIKNIILFDTVLKKVTSIKSKINEPLNKNHLIFTDKEEFDPKKFKDTLKRRMVQQG